MRPSGWVAFWVAGACLAALAPAAAQLTPEEQARRLLEDGRAARQQGKIKQALDSFNIIVTGFANTASVDDALLEIGRTYLESSADLAKAREAFEQVATRYPQADSAPGAYYFLGWIALSQATTPAELDDALAQLLRVQRVYAGSEWVPRALHATGLVQRKAGRYAEALEAERRVYLEYPNDPVAPEALFQCAHDLALLGRYREAMEDYQRVRNRFPKADEAERALDRIAALYRLYGAARPTLSVDPGFNLVAGKALNDVTALLIDARSVLWVASASVNAAFPFENGIMGTSVPVSEPVSLVPASEGPLIVARGGLLFGRKEFRTLSLPGDKPGTLKPLDKIAAALPMRGQGFLVSDLKQGGVLRFDAQGKYLGRFPDAAQREVIRMVRDGEGQLVFLDEKERSVRILDDSGRVLRTIGPRGTGYELKRPADVVVDPAQHLYLADRDAGVFVLSPEGQLIAKVGEDVLKRPRALALAADGELLVYDEKLEKVLRFR
jgi:TolA-binding protein